MKKSAVGMDVPNTAGVTQIQQTLCEWIKSLRLQSGDNLTVHNLPQRCRDGTLLCDLVNRLEGNRQPVLLGITRAPTSVASVIANINKVMRVLRSKLEMNPRYLWSTEAVMSGSPEVVWGLLEDLYNYYASTSSRVGSNIVSPSEPAPASTNTQDGPIRKRDESGMNSLRSSIDRNSGPSSSSAVMQQPLQPHSRLPPITSERQQEVRRWLRDLGIHLQPELEDGPFFEDPLRNGILLCELVGLLENTKLLGVNKHPRVVKAALDNVEKALAFLREKRPNVPIYLLWQSEAIVRGQSDAIWGLLWALKQAYPYAISKPIPAESSINSAQTPYSTTDMKRLELSVCQWIFSLGVLDSATAPRELIQIEPQIRDGTLLCAIAGCLQGRKITGVAQKPKVAIGAYSNIRKALEVLRRLPNMGQRYIWNEKEIFEGNRVSILCLLEDMHRCYDAIPARVRTGDDMNKYHEGGPYLGSFVSMPQQYDMVSGPSNGVVSSVWTPTELKPSIPAPLTRPSSVPVVLKPEPFKHGATQQQHTATSTVGASGRYQLPPPPAPTYPTAQRQTKIGQGEPNTNLPVRSNPSQKSVKQPTVPQSATTKHMHSDTPSKPYLLGRWLMSLGIKLSSPHALQESVVEEFKDGILLCKVVEKVEHRYIEGITKNPKAPASFLHNIKKALDILREKKTMPMTYLWSDHDIREGNQDVIVNLLDDIRKTYGYSLDTFDNRRGLGSSRNI
eukprot:GILK01014960.1.p1 GENE.GILK01014960.1~~GILK01014960.1.p1  ORF type:complete len:790 (+),score=123.52 GILK01014960.1:179-2371(+)